MRLLLTLIFALILVDSFAQTKYQSLIVAEYRVDSTHTGNYTYLVAYNFSDGRLISKDTILGAETSRGPYKGSYVRYDLGKNFIYKNRYVISGIGNVIDTKTKSLVIEESDEFVESKGDTLIFYRENILSGTGYLFLDLKSKRYEFINHAKRDREPRPSPNKKYFLRIDRSKLPYKIILGDKRGKGKTIVKNAGNGPNLRGMSQLPTIETYWLSDSSFLYAVYHLNLSAQKLHQQITVRKFNVKTLTNDIFAVIDSAGMGSRNGRFFRDGMDQLLYRTSAGEFYRIDTANENLLPYHYFELGNGFSEEIKWTASEGRAIRYKNKDIGKHWFGGKVVTNGAIAIEYGEIGSNLGYPKGIKIWFEHEAKWTAIDIPWLSSVIGWINK